MKEEPSAFIVNFADKDKLQDVQKELQSKQDIEYVTSIKDNLGLIISREGIALTTDRLKAYDEIENAMPAYEFGNLPFYLTGEILLQPKLGISIAKILEFIDNNAKVKRKTKYNTFILETKHWDKLMEYSNRIYESGLVIYCHPNFIAPVETTIDPLYSDQYSLNNTGQFGGTAGIDINAPQAWNITKGSSSIRIAVIDQGVEDNEELTGRVLQGYTPQFSEDHPDTQGEPCIGHPPPQYDERFGHGECCAGIIATSHNSIGVRGVAPNVQIVPINIFNDWFIDSYWYNGIRYYFVNYAEDAQDIADAIDWAYDDGNADVLSNSWKSTAYADDIVAAIGRARTQGRNGLGSVVVFSSGNSNLDFSGVTFPANVEGVVTVGAVDRNGNISDYSSRGSEMDLVAPSSGSSNDVRTIDRMGVYGYETGNYTTSFGGTSAACPQVSGVVALMLSSNPSLTETQVRTTLQQTATDMGATGFDNTFGFGRLNAYDAVEDVRLYVTGPFIVCTSNSTFTLHNRPSGTTVNWIKSNNLSEVSGHNTNSYTVKALSYSTFGWGWVEATIYGDCGDFTIREDIWVGKFESTVVTGQAAVCPDELYTYTAQVPGGHSSSYNYDWTYPGNWIWQAEMENWIRLKTAMYNPQYGTVRVRITNTCGTSGYSGMTVYPGYNCGGYYMAFPNPGSSYVDIDVNPEMSTSMEEIYNNDISLSLYNKMGTVVLNSNVESLPYRIDTSGLPNGEYVVKIITRKKGRTEKDQRFESLKITVNH